MLFVLHTEKKTGLFSLKFQILFLCVPRRCPSGPNMLDENLIRSDQQAGQGPAFPFQHQLVF